MEQLEIVSLMDCPLRSVYDATVWFCDAVRVIGPCFHPDTEMGRYIISDGSPSFSSVEVASLQSQLDKAFKLLTDAGVDPYEVCLPVQRQLIS